MIKSLKFSADLNELEKRRIIRYSRGDGRSSYRMPKEVVEAYSRDEVYEYELQEKFVFSD